MKKKVFLPALVFLCITISTSCAGSRETKPDDNMIIIEGRISLVHDGPGSKLVITTKDKKQYKISGKLEQELAENYQQQTVRVEAEIIRELPPPRQTEINVLKILKLIN